MTEYRVAETMSEDSRSTRSFYRNRPLAELRISRISEAGYGILRIPADISRRLLSEQGKNGFRAGAFLLCAVSFLLLSYQFGVLGTVHISGSPLYELFSFSASMAALAAVLLAYVSWLEGAANEYAAKMDEFDHIESEHGKRLFQAFRRPLVSIETEPGDVAEVAASAIREVLNRGTDEGRRVVFFGAASLQTPPKGWVPIRSGDGLDAEDVQSPHQIYQGALEAAASARAHVERYVQLMGDEFKSRSFAVKSDYVKWLKNQVSQMTRNENFVLVDSTRAPKWGTSGARIMAGEFLIDLTHKSGAAIVVRDRRIAGEQIDSAIKEATKGVKRPGNVTVYSKGPITDLKLRFGENAENVSASQLEKDCEDLRKTLIAT